MYSARRLGQLFGLNSQQMNAVLKVLGYLDGSPGNYGVTDKGIPFCTISAHDNGYGGFAARSWKFKLFDDSIIPELENSITDEIVETAKSELHNYKMDKAATNVAKETFETFKEKPPQSLTRAELSSIGKGLGITIAALSVSAIASLINLYFRSNDE